MADNSRYYWIKLRTDFFNQQTVDFILSQKNGCEYIVLYQMLCLQTANNNGELSTKIGEIIIPYDVEKIVRDTKYFDFDTVTMAIELFKRLGLIYESDDTGVLKIANHSLMVGSETEYAAKKREWRERQKALEMQDNVSDNVRENVRENVLDEVRQDIRDKILDIRDIDNRDIDNRNNIIVDARKKKFVKPTLEEVEAYCTERQNNVNAERFVDYYESKGWKVGSSSMKDWKAAVRTWESRDKEERQNKARQEESRLPTADDYDFSDWYSGGMK